MPSGDFIPLGEFKPTSKILTVFAVEGDFDLDKFQEQSILNGMAAEIQPHGGVSGGRPRRLVRHRRGEAKNPKRPAADPRRARKASRRVATPFYNTHCRHCRA